MAQILNYDWYLGTQEWKARAAAAIEFYQCCARCSSMRHLEVHHKTYQRIGREWLTDLQVLCRRCHRRLHATDLIERQMFLPLWMETDWPKAA